MTPGGMCSRDAASVAANAYCTTQSSAAYRASRARGSQRTGLLPFRLPAVVLPAFTIMSAFNGTQYAVLYTFAVHFLRTYCILTAYLLCTYCVHVHAADLMAICCTHTEDILYTYRTHTAHIPYTYCTHTVHILYTYRAHTVQMMYTYCPHDVHILYCSLTHYRCCCLVPFITTDRHWTQTQTQKLLISTDSISKHESAVSTQPAAIRLGEGGGGGGLLGFGIRTQIHSLVFSHALIT